MKIKTDRTIFDEMVKFIEDEGGVDLSRLVAWLENQTDYFAAPASASHHLAVEGGLLRHSINVAQAISRQLPGDTSALMVALFHDLCKVNIYKHVPNVTGVNYYKVDDPFPLGHGEKSAYLLGRFVELADDELMAVRYHMGAWDTDSKGTVSRVFRTYPLAFHLHMADMEAAHDEMTEDNK